LGEGRAVALPKTDEPVRRQCAYFVDCVRRGVRPKPDGRLGLKVVRILEQATRSMQDGGRREMMGWDAAGWDRLLKAEPSGTAPRRAPMARRAAMSQAAS